MRPMSSILPGAQAAPAAPSPNGRPLARGLPVAVLAGGLGTRMGGEAALRPKPMVSVGGRPLIWHVMQRFAGFGHRDFVVALGHQGQVIADYFVHHHLQEADLLVDMASGVVSIGSPCPDWRVRLIRTGSEAMTGGRLRRLAPWLSAGGPFFLSYADVVSDVDLDRMLAFHRAHGRLATMLVVRLPERFGRVRWEGDRVADFREKPADGDGWINGGCFVLEPAVLDRIAGDSVVWEQGPLQALSAEGELMGYRHEGFWAGIDTPAERAALEARYLEGDAPWTEVRLHATAPDGR